MNITKGTLTTQESKLETLLLSKMTLFIGVSENWQRWTNYNRPDGKVQAAKVKVIYKNGSSTQHLSRPIQLIILLK